MCDRYHQRKCFSRMNDNWSENNYRSKINLGKIFYKKGTQQR